jgi:hypothetical protein
MREVQSNQGVRRARVRSFMGSHVWDKGRGKDTLLVCPGVRGSAGLGPDSQKQPMNAE